MNSERYMPSIFPECDKLKEGYDKCFTTFFQQYVNSEYRHRSLENPCQDLFKRYKSCVEEGLKRDKPFEIDLEEVRKEILNTKEDNFNKAQA